MVRARTHSRVLVPVAVYWRLQSSVPPSVKPGNNTPINMFLEKSVRILDVSIKYVEMVRHAVVQKDYDGNHTHASPSENTAH